VGWSWRFDGKRVLVAGIGGGSDVVAARAVAGMIAGAARVAFGNTKRRPGPNLLEVPGLRCVSRVSEWRPAPEEIDVHGTCNIDHAVPDLGGERAYVFLLNDENDTLSREIASLGFDEIIAVDIGGDSLTHENGRDVEMLAALRATGLPVKHLIVAPGADGQSSCEELAVALAACTVAFPAADLRPLLETLGPHLSVDRTPNIILSALDTSDEEVNIPRERRPTMPARWLRTVYLHEQPLDRWRRHFQRPRIFLPVIHVNDDAQARRNVEVARQADADGVFLIMHYGSYKQLLPLAARVAEEHPHWFVGVNCLDLVPYEVVRRVSPAVRGIWSDNAGLDTSGGFERFATARVASGWEGLHFGGVAFKYQRLVGTPDEAAQRAVRRVDVICTSGPGTGRAADPQRIEGMRAAAAEMPLALASGVTPENIEYYLPHVDAYLVATGIEISFEELDPHKTAELGRKIRGYEA